MAKRPTASPDGAPEIVRTQARRGRPPSASRVLAEENEASPERVSRSAPRPARAANRQANRDSNHQVGRHPHRRGAVVVEGRDGETLTRRQAVQGDVFFVPPNEVPDGWDYQWNTVEVTGSADAARSISLDMHANGWRPVPASRHPGRWTAPGETGAIVVKGLRLEERPTQLGEEARQEDIQRARAQMRDQTDALQLSKKLPSGFASERKYRGTGGDVRMSIDKGLDIPMPEHQVDEG